ncbi:CALMODULIN-BINDING PROTEIN60 [Arabidopsis thaliana x Arabidopsis arenosa]|uniref:CALMODULIN-BINDING PROTEIN60 n=1 Tax=Arabidopsis thaliana x Arabidopsis arenosa TaxID=1240361 RepID=A0A8T1XRL3_9BRAS|nr:CALMODULIN-BINDING PROTEIN60 [Arabidopsis thaliana x Arabidopsis arenosa]
MSQKREFEEAKGGASEDKRRRFKSVVQEVMRLQTVKHFLEPVLEPLIRKVVKEEVELALGKHLAGIKWICEKETHPLESRNLQLKFLNNLSLPVFTSARIEGDEGQAIRLGLIDSSTGQIVSSSPASSAKLEIFVVEGDFDSDSDWTTEDIRNNIVREREGKKPLLNGNVFAVLNDGIGVMDEISFTDNSSWTRSRKFRLGVRMVDQFDFVKIREAITESFVVRDHRGELYKKHHPPSLFDEVWRLEKIGKDGAFHKRLNCSNINTVKDFLTHFHLNTSKLRQVLGTGMSSKMWEITLDHARSCVLDSSVHVYQAPGFQKKTAVVFNVVAQVLGLLVDFQYIPAEKLSEIEKAQAEVMVIDALSHLNEVISYDDEVSMMRNVLNVSASQSRVGIDYSGLSLTSLDGYGFVSNLHNTAECSGQYSDDVDMEVTPHGLYEDYDKLWNCSQILGFEEPQSELQSALDDFMSQKNALVGKAHSKRWTKLFSVSKWLSVFKYVTVRKNMK